MAKQTAGQQERERAFQEWLCESSYHRHGCGHVPWAEVRGIFNIGDLRLAFDAGVERGQELRGCCHAHPDNGRLAVKEPDD